MEIVSTLYHSNWLSLFTETDFFNKKYLIIIIRLPDDFFKQHIIFLNLTFFSL